VQRRVGGYNLDALVPKNTKTNLAHILVGSEGTLAFPTAIELKLAPVLGSRVVGVCHFGQFYEGDETRPSIWSRSGRHRGRKRSTGPCSDLCRAPFRCFRDVIPGNSCAKDPEAPADGRIRRGR
jgi:FAD/FMN-containing dehydrogenase